MGEAWTRLALALTAPGVLGLAALGGCAAAPDPAGTAFGTPASGAPIVIAHRGASGDRPEHTMAAYHRAIQQGADCIEPDLVMTRDGVLVARHEPILSISTDIETRPEFAARKRVLPLPDGGGEIEDWFIGDFTLEELRSLRAVQTREGRSRIYDGLYTIPTFDDVLALAAGANEAGAGLCVYPEAKTPHLFEAMGLDMGGALLGDLARRGFDGPDALVFIQSFDFGWLEALRGRTEHRLVFLDYRPAGMSEGEAADLVARAAAAGLDGLGVNHAALFGPGGAPNGLAAAAHEVGLVVHSWTYRQDAPFSDEGWAADLNAAFDAGVDGVFADQPGPAAAIRDAWSAATAAGPSAERE